MLEKQIQEKIVHWLRGTGWLVWKNQQGPYGSAGIPDLTAIRGGEVLFIEVKRPGERLTKLQAAVVNDINAHGVVAGRVTSLDDLQMMIRDSTMRRTGAHQYQEV